MNKSCLLLGLLLIIGIAGAVEYGPTVDVGAPDTTDMGVPLEAQSRAAMIPKAIPQEIIDAGAEAEYLAVTCAMARHNLQKFIDGADTVKSIWDDVAISLQSEGISIDTSALSGIKDGILSRVDALCVAIPQNYGQAIQNIIDYSLGANGLEQSLKSMGSKLESDINAKMDAYTQEGEALQARVNSMTGGKSPQEIESIVAQIESKSIELQSLINNPLLMQDPSNQARVQTLTSEIQSLQASLGASDPQSQEEAMALAAELEEFGEKARVLGTKIESAFGGMPQKMQSAFSGKDYSNLSSQINENYYQLFLKVFNKKVVDVNSKKAEIASYGIDASLFDEVTQWADEKKEQAKSVFIAEATEKDIMEFIALINLESAEMEIRINSIVEGLIRDKYIDSLENFRNTAKEGIDAAKNGGLNMSYLEELTNKLEILRNEAIELDAQGNDSLAYEKIKEAEILVELIKQEYALLQSQGIEVKEQAQEVIAALNAEKEKVLALKSAAQSKSIDTAVIETIESELYALESHANILLSEGKNAQALLIIEQAKAKFEALKIEYSRLLLEVKSK